MVGLPWWLSGKEPTCNAGDAGSDLGLGRSPGGGHGNPLQYFHLKSPMDRGAWWGPWGRREWDTTEHARMYAIGVILLYLADLEEKSYMFQHVERSVPIAMGLQIYQAIVSFPINKYV